ncbi:hypothetical protein Trco_003599 [Trichoderma cornu-damae]|uniref:RRM domain-containing protein n=1 Tax=Trichoderma cornu-damae TaxID=654480 RepID=A0A9P8QJ10_9HYPO|nr:hypothetical protein Trco_003599 [Trichoderma cornu-damae]
MKSKRAAAAASAEDFKPVDLAGNQPAKKRKRTDEDDGPDNDVKKPKKFRKEKKSKKEKKDKKNKHDKEEEKTKPKKDKSKYNKETRKEKKDKLKDLRDLPEGMDVDNDAGNAKVAEATAKPEAEPKTNGSAEDKAAKELEKHKEDKKDRKEEKKREKKEKKEKKKEKKALQRANKALQKEKKALKKEAKAGAPSPKDVPQAEDAIDLDASSAQKPGRNIVFVGNLPYSATAASITAHFASLKPVAVRCLTKKDDPKVCRGIAFVEFGTPAHQRTCLDKFHHSTFEDGTSAPRKINVELTSAGGGGKSKGRQDKIMEKNKKLDENRAKRIEREKTDKDESQAKDGDQANAQPRMEIHPSRLARLPGLGR